MNTDVLVIGAGPTGLTLACELALAGVHCRVLERRATAPNITRAFAVHARTLELLDARGLADDVVARGVPVREIAPAPGAMVDLRTLDSRFPMILIAPQSATEQVLEHRARTLGVEIVRGAEVVGLRQDDDGVEVELRGGRVTRARLRRGHRRRAQHRPPTAGRRLRRDPVRDAHHARRRSPDHASEGGDVRQRERAGRGGRRPVR